MNAFTSSSALAWLGDIALQSTVVLGVALLVSLPVWRLSAAKRHALLAAGLCCVPLLMLGSVGTPRWTWRTAPSSPATTDWTINTSLAQLSMANQVTNPRLADVPVGVHVAKHSWNAVVLLWACGVGLGLAWLGAAILRLRWLRRTSMPFNDPRVAIFMAAHPRVDIRAAKQSMMPMTWGLLRPVILLPAVASEWTNERLQLVLQHELAHIERRDALTHLLGTLSACLLWFHPLVWIVRHKLVQAREAACDDHVLRQTDEAPAEYAEQLLQTITALRASSQVRAFAPALAIGMASVAARELKARLASILDEQANRSVFTPRRAWAITCMCSLAAVLLSGLSACREAPKQMGAGHVVSADASRIYFLSDAQFHQLLSGGSPSSAAPNDPFGPKTQDPPQTEGSTDLLQLAMRIRTKLLADGIVFQPNDKGEALVMTDARAMKVWADDANHDKLTQLLIQAASTRMVRLNTYAFEVPITPQNLRYFVAEDSTAGFAMRGGLSEIEGKALLKKLGDAKDIKLMAAPTITSKSGQRTSVEVVREFLYPTEFDPPHVPKPDKPYGDKLNDGSFPVTPTTPTAFEMKPLGLRMESQATIKADGTVDLALAPELNSFEGFINYGSPINAKSTDFLGTPVSLTLTENRIPQPVFSTIKYNTSVRVTDRSFVILGGAANQAGTTAAIAQKPDTSHTNDLNLKALPNWTNSKTAIFFLIQASSVNAGGK